MKVEVITEKRRDDWIAYIEGHPETQEAAPTRIGAVAKLRSRSTTTIYENGRIYFILNEVIAVP